MFDVWKNVLAEVEQKISHEAYVTWFTGLTLVSANDGLVIVGVPSVLKTIQIQKKYNTIVKDALINNGIEVKEIRYEAPASSTIRRAPREVSIVDIPKNTSKKPVFKNFKSFTTGLNSNYTLDNFVVGSNNDLAVSVAKNVVDEPGKRYNPFFLYGGPGLGKTHLVQAVGNALIKKDPNLKVLYIPVNHFYAEFVNALKDHRGEEFSKKYRSLDVLIIDDFQMIVGRDASQKEFFNLFNDLYQSGKQIIVTSDRLPDQIKAVDARLASRLTWAGAIDLQLPSFEDKCAIIKLKAEFMGADIEDEAVEFLAKNIKTNIRDLEGEFNKLMTMAELRNTTPLSIINSGYTNTATTASRANISPQKVVSSVAKYYDLSVKELCSKSRVTHIKTARQIAMYLLSEELSMSTTKAAMEVGLKDHTTAMHGIKKVREDLKSNFSLREQIVAIREKIYE